MSVKAVEHSCYISFVVVIVYGHNIIIEKHDIKIIVKTIVFSKKR